MAFMGASHLILLVLVAHLPFSRATSSELFRDNENAAESSVASPAPVPNKNRLALVSFLPLITEREIVGGVAVYDDSATERDGDYFEFYNTQGDLLAVSWFDGFGIERAAIDRGLLEDAEELEGVFVLVLDGDPT
jgi:hypothetical protein